MVRLPKPAIPGNGSGSSKGWIWAPVQTAALAAHLAITWENKGRIARLGPPRQGHSKLHVRGCYSLLPFPFAPAEKKWPIRLVDVMFI
jgi:hypothetical protein